MALKLVLHDEESSENICSTDYIRTIDRRADKATPNVRTAHYPDGVQSWPRQLHTRDTTTTDETSTAEEIGKPLQEVAYDVRSSKEK